MRENPWHHQWYYLIRAEKAYMQQHARQLTSPLNQKIGGKIPPKLQGTLEAAFEKSFQLVFDKGTNVIEKTIDLEKIEEAYKTGKDTVDLNADPSALQKLLKQANSAWPKNMALSVAEGVGLGFLGVGLPDIPLFTALLLRSVYEISAGHGYPYSGEGEKYFVLQLIKAALSYGKEYAAADLAINEFADIGELPKDYTPEKQIAITAKALSDELLYTKFLQGVPIVGVAGGIFDAVCMQKVQKYAKLKYTRRMLVAQKKAETK